KENPGCMVTSHYCKEGQNYSETSWDEKSFFSRKFKTVDSNEDYGGYHEKHHLQLPDVLTVRKLMGKHNTSDVTERLAKVMLAPDELGRPLLGRREFPRIESKFCARDS